MELQIWPFLALAIVLLLPTCAGDLKSDGSAPALAVPKKGSPGVALGNEDKRIMKRSISQYLTQRLVPRHKGVRNPSTSDHDNLGDRARRDIHAFLDTLEPHQLHRLRRAISSSRLRMRADNQAKHIKKVVVNPANARSF